MSILFKNDFCLRQPDESLPLSVKSMIESTSLEKTAAPLNLFGTRGAILPEAISVYSLTFIFPARFNDRRHTYCQGATGNITKHNGIRPDACIITNHNVPE